ncbi:MAG: TRAP transporter small permease [Clostridia bacterium]|nr:TRAP transporter small permease [Clostridia bacterium]
MDNIMKPISKVMNALYKLFCLFSQGVLLVIVAIVTMQVVLRWLKMNVPWGEEVALFFMVWMAFISFAIGVIGDLHISIVMVFDRLPKRAQKVLEFIINVIILIVGIFFIVYGKNLVSMTMRSTLPATKWPKGTMYMMIPVSGVFVTYASLLRLLKLERYMPTFSKD